MLARLVPASPGASAKEVDTQVLSKDIHLSTKEKQMRLRFQHAVGREPLSGPKRLIQCSTRSPRVRANEVLELVRAQVRRELGHKLHSSG